MMMSTCRTPVDGKVAKAVPRGPHKLSASLESSSVSRDRRTRRERLRGRRTESASRPGQVHANLLRVFVGSFVSDADQKHSQDARRGFRIASRHMSVTRRSAQFGCCFQPTPPRSASRSCKAALVWRPATPRIAAPRIAPPPGYIRAAQLSRGWCYPRGPQGTDPFETRTPSPNQYVFSARVAGAMIWGWSLFELALNFKTSARPIQQRLSIALAFWPSRRRRHYAEEHRILAGVSSARWAKEEAKEGDINKLI